LRLADDVPAAVKRRRLNELLARQESIGADRNRDWLGREVEVLVERITPRKHGAAAVAAAPASTNATAANDDDAPADDPALHVPGLYGAAGEGSVALAGRTRHNKLVHLSGDPGLVGRAVTVRIEFAGPFALRGAMVTPAPAAALASPDA
jgi:tRNA A37 methylthiotransferase MiaB